MADKPDGECTRENCFLCRLWPKVVETLDSPSAAYWVDMNTGEVLIGSGLRILSDGSYVPMEHHFVTVKCTCGNEGSCRADLLMTGRVDRCPECQAEFVESQSN